MEEKTTLKESIDHLNELLEHGKVKPQKIKKFKLPRSARISKAKLKKGYVTVATIHENKNIEFTKEPIIDSTFSLSNPVQTFHAINDDDIYFYKGRPFIWQAKTKINPYNPLKGKNETYGQAYIMARMEGDKIITKKKFGWGLGIGLLIVVGIVIYYLLAGG